MKGPAKQVCTSEESTCIPNFRTAFVTVAVFEKDGKTVLQPVTTKQDTETLQELFQNSILEVWVPNGKASPAEFDVSILKYKAQMQTPTPCIKAKHRACLKNYFDAVVDCEQCPVGEQGEE
jgi:hypothetical protein